MSTYKKIYIAICLLLILGCAYKPPFEIDYSKLPPDIRAYYPVEKALSARLWALCKFGMPIFVGDLNKSRTVFSTEDLFVNSYPTQEEVWSWIDKTSRSTFSCSFYSLGTLGLSYSASSGKELQVSIQDTCSKTDYFCLEFNIQGLKRENRTTLYKFQVLFRKPKTKQWVYLYDTSPIVGGTGLNAVDVSFFMDVAAVRRRIFSEYKHEYLEAVKIPVIIIVWDFRAKEKREAVFEMEMQRKEGEKNSEEILSFKVPSVDESFTEIKKLDDKSVVPKMLSSHPEGCGYKSLLSLTSPPFVPPLLSQGEGDRG